jgi:hypothetical protein
VEGLPEQADTGGNGSSTTGAGSEMTMLSCAVHPRESVTWQEYVPGARPMMVSPVAAPNAHRKEYGATPFVASAMAVPSLDPLHVASVPMMFSATIEGFAAKVTEVVAGQLFGPETVQP